MEELVIDSANAALQLPVEAILIADTQSANQEREIRADGRRIEPLGYHTVVSTSLTQNFARLLPDSPLLECIGWAWEGDVLRVWTVISHRDRELQRKIYAAESRFLDAFGDRRCDFSVVFRENRDVSEILPTRAQVLTFAA